MSTVCTDTGWLPQAEDMRCYHCVLPPAPLRGHWDCDLTEDNTMVCLLQCDPAHTVSGPHIVECSAEGKKFRPSPQSSKCVPLPKSSAGFLAEASTSCAPPAEVAAEVAAGIDPTIEDTEEEANSNLNTSEDIKDEEDTEEEANSNLNTAVDASSDLEVGDGEEDNNVKNIS